VPRVRDQIETEIDAAYVDALRALGAEHGLDHIGFAPATVMDRARTALVERKRSGLSDSMEFTYRNPARSTDPSRAVTGARALVVAARSYAFDAPAPPSDAPHGAVARYAWVDHYAPLRAGLWAIARKLRADGFKAVPFADDNSVVDREAAWLAGLGWFGKNANVLLPGAGSFFVLGSVVTTAPLPTSRAPMADGCGACRRCIDGCPTGAIVAPGVVDASRCLAWLLQRPGVFPLEHRAALGGRMYGCDECQLVCPPTVRSSRHVTAAPDGAQPWVGLIEVLDADDETILATWGRWYIHDRNPMWVRRNALVALGNVGSADNRDVVRVLTVYLSHREPILREHAAWAANRLGVTGRVGG
jgi:epoxyqueuosine reductase